MGCQDGWSWTGSGPVKLNKSKKCLQEEAGEENRGNSLFKHTFRLRPDQSVTVELPADLTSQEAARMARFIETLPFQGDTIDRAS